MSGKKTDSDDFFDRPGYLIRLAHQKSVATYTAAWRDLDITVPQYIIMAALSKYPEIALSDVAEMVAMDKSTTGAVIERLRERGLVEVRNSQSDLRAKQIRLSVEGQSLIPRMASATKLSQEHLFAALSGTERQIFISLTRKLVGRQSGKRKDIRNSSQNSKLEKQQPIFLSGATNPLGKSVLGRLEENGTKVLQLDALLRGGATFGISSEKTKFTGIVICRVWPELSDPTSRKSNLIPSFTEEIRYVRNWVETKKPNLKVIVALALNPATRQGEFALACAAKQMWLTSASELTRALGSSKGACITIVTSALQIVKGRYKNSTPPIFSTAISRTANLIFLYSRGEIDAVNGTIIDQAPGF